MGSSSCENCHKRPKFGTHRFCGKTCATEAAAKLASKQSQPIAKAVPRNTGHQKATQKAVQLCAYCGQKPKFSSFDYCGKSCAALAGAAQTKPPAPATQAVPAVKQKATRAPHAPPNSTQALAPTKPHRGPPTKAPVPQNDSTEEEEEEEETGGSVSTDLDAYPSDSESESESVPAAATPQPNAKSVPRGGKLGSGVPRIIPGACAIPGCVQQAHVDKNGAKSPYCSLKHREEAVKLGLETACILCQRYPQSASDYFCSAACRNQSMTKI